MVSRREFLQFGMTAAAAFSAAGFSTGITRALAQQKITQDDLLKFDSKGQVTLLHFTDVHAQLKPVYFRPPDTNIGVGAFAGIPQHDATPVIGGRRLGEVGEEGGGGGHHRATAERRAAAFAGISQHDATPMMGCRRLP